MIRKLNDERGLAMITGIMVSLVVLIFSIAVVDLSAHNMRSSDRDRKRVDAIGTAEAGLDATMSAIQAAVIDISGGNYTLPCTVNATMPQAPSSQYTVTVNYYATYPPTGSPMACPPTTPPAGATLTSVGNAVTKSPTSVTRTMESQVRLTPVYGQIGGNAIFSDSGLNLQNQLTVNGNVGNDGNLYTNGDFSCNNNSTIAGSLLVQGNVNLSSSCTFNQDVYAKLAITMNNSALVGHDVTSSSSSLVMANSAHINHNVVVAVPTCSSCTTGSGGRVGGTVTTGHISPAPPKLTMPQIDYDASAWTAAGYQTITYSNCTTAEAAIDAGWTSPTVVRITPACSLAFSGDNINMQNDVAIMADGPIAFNNHNIIQSSDSNKRTLFLIEPTNGISNPDCTVTNRNIDISNQTDFEGVYLFAYSQCTVTYNNNNSGLGGQIIGGTVNIQNLYNLTFHPITIPGGVITGFNEDLAFIREIVNS